MTAAWPAINQYAQVNGYSETPDVNVASFTPEVGPPKLRRRMSISTDVISFTTWMTATEYATFLTFYKTTIKDGTLPFTRTRPRTQATETFVFTSVPVATYIAYNEYAVTISIRNIPT